MEGYFPILLHVKDEPCLVVGGGTVAERRIASLLEAKARVTVVSPHFTEQIQRWVEAGSVQGIARRYESDDQQGMRLVVAATDSGETNEAICRLAQQEGRLVNMVEHPETGNFIVPSVVRRGKLIIAVSTQGASPIVSASIRRQIEETIGEEYEEYLDFLSEFRLKVQELVKDTKHRQAVFREVLKHDLPGKIKNGQFEAWKEQVLTRLLQGDNPFLEKQASERIDSEASRRSCEGFK